MPKDVKVDEFKLPSMLAKETSPPCIETTSRSEEQGSPLASQICFSLQRQDYYCEKQEHQNKCGDSGENILEQNSLFPNN